jgi:hypothetical protein
LGWGIYRSCTRPNLYSSLAVLSEEVVHPG